MEAEEEAGFQVNCVRKVFEAFMSPGAVTEKLHFFVAEYSPEDRISKGGVLAHEGEDIEVMETPIEDALGMIVEGKIVDAKTIMLLQYAKLHIFQGKSGLD
jgi:nudix-type nucleoside diphosphatase (YffH/AdpP family)